MFEIISNPFENVGESLSGLAIEKAIEAVTPSTSKGFSWGRFLLGVCVIILGVWIYYFTMEKEEQEKNRRYSELH